MKNRFPILFLFCFAQCASIHVLPAFSALRFTNVTTTAGITHGFQMVGGNQEVTYMSGGAVAEDFDGDGRLDLYVLQGQSVSNLLYMNNGDGTFSNQAPARGVDVHQNSMGASAADYDNDGDVDICVTRMNATPLLLVNDGTGHFLTEVITGASQNNVTSPSWGDVNNDGLLDLIIGRWLWSEQGLTFYLNTGGQLVPTEFRTAPYEDHALFSPRFADINGDRFADILAVADFGNSQLYVNMGDGHFQRASSTNGVGTDQNGMGSAVGDYDNDGDLDWFVSSIFDDSGLVEGNWGTTGNRLYQNQGNGTFIDATDAAGVRDGNWGWGSSFGDLDNDGDLDLFHVNGWPETQSASIVAKFNNQPARLFENRGDGTFTNVAAAAGADDTGQGRGLILWDYDSDGDLDIYICNNQDLLYSATNITRGLGPPVLLRNDSDNSNAWVKILLDGKPPYHDHGIGSRVYVTAGGSEQMRELHASTGFLAQEPGRMAHFGLGTNPIIGEVRMEWPQGDSVLVSNVEVNQTHTFSGPSATLSARRVLEGETVTASAEGVAAPHDWTIDGQSFTQTVVEVVFTNGGAKQLLLQLYNLAGTQLERTEVYRVEVVDVESADNLAPLLDNTGDMRLPAIDEDDTTNPGGTVAGILASTGSDRVTDADAGDPEGMAVMAVNTNAGSWQYSTNSGANWMPLAGVSDHAARLLDGSARVRCLPAPNLSGEVETGFAFRAWDHYAGSNGGTADATINGLTNAFSSATEDVGIVLHPVNDGPTLVAQDKFGLEDVPFLVTGLTIDDIDADEDAGSVLRASFSVASGTLHLVSTSGVSLVGGSDGTAYVQLEAALSNLQATVSTMMYLGATNYNGTDTLHIAVSDQGFTGGGALKTTGSLSLVVGPMNDAPFVANPPARTEVAEDSPATPVHIGGIFDDVDIPSNGDALTFALVGNDDPGLISAQLNGTNLQLTPLENQHGTAQVTVRATDLALAFAEHVLTVAVQAVNDPPQVAGHLEDIIVAEDAVPTVVDLSGLFADADQETDGDALSLSVSNLQSALLSASIDGGMLTLTYMANANGNAQVVVHAVDLAGSSTSTPVSVFVTPVNDPPVVAAPMDDVEVGVGSPDLLIDLDAVFDDVDIESNSDSLNFTITGNTPPLVNASVDARRLRLKIPVNMAGSALVTVRASDDFGRFIEDNVQVTVTGTNTAPTLDVSGVFQLDPILEGDLDNPGTSITDLLASRGDAMSDPDPGAVQGVAVTAVVSGDGNWDYSLDGGTNWQPVATSSETNALLLAADGAARIRFVPGTGFIGLVDPGFLFRAWDQTAGVSGSRADVSVNGGLSAFSTQRGQARIRVRSGKAVRNDFDGDGLSDMAVIDPVTWTWFILKSSGGISTRQFGFTGVVQVPADYDGDLVTDLGVFYPASGTWYIRRSSDGQFQTRVWGYRLTQPLPHDYDGDGKADITVFEPGSGNWYILQSSDGHMRVQKWGYAGTQAVPGDFDGDDQVDIGVFETSTGNWYVRQSLSGSLLSRNWGYAATQPVAADYDGDGLADMAVYETATGNWYLLSSLTGLLRFQNWGYFATTPVRGDYDGDAVNDLGVFEPSTGNWYLLGSATGITIRQFGYSSVIVVGTEP